MLHKKDKVHILFGTKSGFRVAELIFTYPNRVFHLRELAREAKVSTTSATNIIEDLNRLHEYKIIKTQDTKVTKNIQADLESPAYTDYKRIFNLYRLTRYGLIQKLVDYFNKPEVIVVFGSFAKGEDIEQSDIDILVISKKKERDINLGVYEKTFDRKINLHLLPSLAHSSPEFKNAVANGIVLYGYLKVLP